MSIEQPLRWIARKCLRQPVWIFLRCQFLPVREIERNFEERTIRDDSLLVQRPYSNLKCGGLCKYPDRKQMFPMFWNKDCNSFVKKLTAVVSEDRKSVV